MPVNVVFEDGMKRVVKPLLVDIDWRSGWCTLVGEVENSWREIESVRMIEWRALASRFWRIYDISLSRRTKG